MGAARKRQAEIVEPILIGLAVAVGIDDYFTNRRLHADVARVGQSHVALADVTHGGKFLKDFLRLIGGPVIDEDHLEIGIAQLLH